MKRRSQTIQRLVTSSPFDTAVSIALAEISANDNTRREYRRDLDLWLSFCRDYGIDGKAPPDGSVVSWVAWMKKEGHASKSRARRISALSSIFRELRRKRVVETNPFSVDDGPRREKVSTERPTKLATAATVGKMIAACEADSTPIGTRDLAIIRLLWATGMRRISLLSMTFERLDADGDDYVATVIKKGGENMRVLVTGKAKASLDEWLAVMKEGELTKGPIWRQRNGEPISTRALNRLVAKRGPGVSPHMLRVSFLTYNRASLDSKQDAAGHSDPATTMLYDRTSWRGREAFEQMPEIEDVR